MRWEFLGKQELHENNGSGRGYVYAASLWRTPVLGGWLLMTVNSKSNDPQPVMTFYPDADHHWTGHTPPEADYLLRPVLGEIPPPQLPGSLSDADSGPKQLES